VAPFIVHKGHATDPRAESGKADQDEARTIKRFVAPDRIWELLRLGDVRNRSDFFSAPA